MADFGEALLDHIPTWTLVDEIAQQGLGPNGLSSDLDECRVQLDNLQSLLQSGKGTDNEWLALLSARDFALVDSLLALCGDEYHPASAPASRCLAFAGNVYRRVWLDYIVDEAHLDAVCRVSQVGVRHCLRAHRAIREEKKLPLEVNNYLGFDKRDIAEYNLGSDYEVPSPQSLEGRRSSTHGIAGMENVDDSQASIMVWLLLMFQFFSEKSNYLSAVLRRHAQAVQECESTGHDPPHSLTFTTFVFVTESLLRACPAFSEDAYLQAIRVVAAMNRQCVAVPSEDGTTLVAKRCGLVHAGSLPSPDPKLSLTPTSPTGASTSASASASASASPSASASAPPPAAHSISEGLLHLLNDCGYPSHTSPETIPVLQLCTDLISYVSEHSVLYTNDLRVCCDIVLRELTNISAPRDRDRDRDRDNQGERDDCSASDGIGGTNDAYDEEVRVMYLRLTGALLSFHLRKQIPADELYRGADLRALVQSMAKPGHSSRTWSREEALEVLELWDAL